MNYLLASEINDKLHRDCELAIRRFEASDLTAVVDLRDVLTVIRATHAMFNPDDCSMGRRHAGGGGGGLGLELDDFDTILEESKDSVGKFVIAGRGHGGLVAAKLAKMTADYGCCLIDVARLGMHRIKAPARVEFRIRQ